MTKLVPDTASGVALLQGSTVVRISTCTLYDLNSLCQNGGQCADQNNAPVCNCPVYSTFQYTGTFCETRAAVSTTSTTNTSSSDSTLLVVAIVLPVVGFLTLLILTIIALLLWYKK